MIALFHPMGLIWLFIRFLISLFHYNDVIIGAMASQITSLTIVYSTVYSGADQRKHQIPASLALVWGIHRLPVNSLHKWPVTRKMFPFDDVIMCLPNRSWSKRPVRLNYLQDIMCPLFANNLSVAAVCSCLHYFATHSDYTRDTLGSDLRRKLLINGDTRKPLHQLPYTQYIP